MSKYLVVSIFKPSKSVATRSRAFPIVSPAREHAKLEERGRGVLGTAAHSGLYLVIDEIAAVIRVAEWGNHLTMMQLVRTAKTEATAARIEGTCGVPGNHGEFLGLLRPHFALTGPWHAGLRVPMRKDDPVFHLAPEKIE